MTNEELVLELNAAPNHKIVVWAVLYEDIYETARGDGYFAYLADAFFEREQAEHFATASSAYRSHVREIQLSYLNGRIYALRSSLKEHESIDLDKLVAALSHDPESRQPKSQY